MVICTQNQMIQVQSKKYFKMAKNVPPHHKDWSSHLLNPLLPKPMINSMHFHWGYQFPFHMEVDGS